MYTSQDENSWHLSNYLHHQDQLEKQWENTMIEKQEAVVELAVKLIKHEVDDELFNWVFTEYLENGEDDEICFRMDLELINMSEGTLVYEEEDIIASALEGACKSLYDCELDEITNCDPRGLVNQVLKGLE